MKRAAWLLICIVLSLSLIGCTNVPLFPTPTPEPVACYPFITYESIEDFMADAQYADFPFLYNDAYIPRDVAYAHEVDHILVQPNSYCVSIYYALDQSNQEAFAWQGQPIVITWYISTDNSVIDAETVGTHWPYADAASRGTFTDENGITFYISKVHYGIGENKSGYKIQWVQFDNYYTAEVPMEYTIRDIINLSNMQRDTMDS